MAFNDVTGKPLVSMAANQNYYDNYDRIFSKKKPKLELVDPPVEVTPQEENEVLPTQSNH